MIKQKDKENSHMQMEISTRDFGSTTNQPKAPSPIKMEQSIKENFLIFINMTRERKHDPMDHPTRVPTKIIIKRERESMSGQMERPTMEHGA